MNREELLSDLIRDEGLKLKPYNCTAGKMTIGIGRNLSDRGITQTEAMYLCDNDIDISYAELHKNFLWFRDLDNKRQNAVINLHINLGLTRLSKFKKFLAAMTIKDYKVAAEELEDSLWFRQVGDRAKRIQDIILGG